MGYIIDNYFLIGQNFFLKNKNTTTKRKKEEDRIKKKNANKIELNIILYQPMYAFFFDKHAS